MVALEKENWKLFEKQTGVVLFSTCFWEEGDNKKAAMKCYHNCLLKRTRDGSWTHTSIAANRILSPACLPVPPPGWTKKKFQTCVWNFPERKTGLEPATSTLARSRSTKWATFAIFEVFSFYQKELFVFRIAKIRFAIELQNFFIYILVYTKYCPELPRQACLYNDVCTMHNIRPA